MEKLAALFLVSIVCSVVGLPLETADVDNGEPEVVRDLHAAGGRVHERAAQAHDVHRRFINPLFSLEMADTGDSAKIRTKRSEEECEKLQLCKLHARSQRNFLAAFELYFVNKENARLWDHRARSAADCERRFGDC